MGKLIGKVRAVSPEPSLAWSADWNHAGSGPQGCFQSCWAPVTLEILRGLGWVVVNLCGGMHDSLALDHRSKAGTQECNQRAGDLGFLLV